MNEFKTWEEYTPLEQAATLYSDYFKDVNGFRPRFDQSSWTVEDYDREMVSLSVEMEVIMNNDKANEEAAIVAFEKLVADTIATGAGDRETAIRWIRSVDTDVYTMHDDGYFEFENRLPYGYLKKVA